LLSDCKLSRLGLDHAEIEERMAAEGYNTNRMKGQSFQKYVANVLYRHREDKGLRFRLAAAEREMFFLRKLMLDLARTSPKDLRRVAQKLEKELAKHPYRPASVTGEYAPESLAELQKLQ
jgi:hypothetical protein